MKVLESLLAVAVFLRMSDPNGTYLYNSAESQFRVACGISRRYLGLGRRM